MSQLQFIEYRPGLASHFTRMNLAWVEKYFVVEPLDKMVLEDPESNIINKEGHIFFASLDGNIVGTFALLKKQDGIFELGKMAVSEEYQARKIGNRMLEYCISKARLLKIKKLVLYSNTILQPAIHLYKKYGFVEVPVGNAEYKRSNIKMELDLN